MEPSGPLLEWSDVVVELLGFLAAFLAAGAVGFRFGVAGRLRTGEPADRAVMATAVARAGRLGLLGAVVGAVLLYRELPELAGRQHVTVAGLLAHVPAAQLQVGFAALLVIGLALVVMRLGIGWWLAAIGLAGGALRAGLLGRWPGLVNPVHEMAGGLWIGTLFMLVVAGLGTVLSSATPAARRGALTAGMVRAFSPLALGSAALLAAMGVITAWRHLHRLDALWTTPYGYALIGKLCAVGGVLLLGAYNWKRQSPRLGDETSSRSLQRSATNELLAALVVLIVTAILVSLPSPRG